MARLPILALWRVVTRRLGTLYRLNLFDTITTLLNIKLLSVVVVPGQIPLTFASIAEEGPMPFGG